MLTFEEPYHYALTAADDTAQAEFIASLMGHLGVDDASTITLNPNAMKRDAKHERSSRPFEEALERFAPVYAALAVEDPARIEFGTALTSQGNKELKGTPKIIHDTTGVRRPCDRNYIPRMSLTMAMHYIACVETEHRVATAKRLNIKSTK